MNQKILEKDLLEGEIILWSEQRKTRIFKFKDIIYYFYSYMAFLGVLVLTQMYMKFGGLIALLFIEMVFRGVITSSIGYFFMRIYTSRKTYYYITNKRVIKFVDFKKRRIYAAYIGDIDYSKICNKLKKTKSLLFGEKGTLLDFRDKVEHEYLYGIAEMPYLGIGFLDIDEAKAVQSIFEKAKSDYLRGEVI